MCNRFIAYQIRLESKIVEKSVQIVKKVLTHIPQFGKLTMHSKITAKNDL